MFDNDPRRKKFYKVLDISGGRVIISDQERRTAMSERDDILEDVLYEIGSIETQMDDVITAINDIPLIQLEDKEIITYIRNAKMSIIDALVTAEVALNGKDYHE